MDAEKSVQEKEHQLRQTDLDFNIAYEEKKKAEAKAYALSAMMKAIGSTDSKILQALASVGMKPDQLIALVFHELIQRAGHIGELNVSPDLLRELMKPEARQR